MALHDIMNNIATVLATINGSAPYTTTIAKVNEKRVNDFIQDGTNFPAARTEVESVEHGDPEDIGSAMPKAAINIHGWVHLEDAQVPHDALLPFWEDVKTALRLDTTRGGYAVFHYFGGTTFAYGETDAEFLLRTTVIYSEAS